MRAALKGNHRANYIFFLNVIFFQQDAFAQNTHISPTSGGVCPPICPICVVKNCEPNEGIVVWPIIPGGGAPVDVANIMINTVTATMANGQGVSITPIVYNSTIPARQVFREGQTAPNSTTGAIANMVHGAPSTANITGHVTVPVKWQSNTATLTVCDRNAHVTSYSGQRTCRVFSNGACGCRNSNGSLANNQGWNPCRSSDGNLQAMQADAVAAAANVSATYAAIVTVRPWRADSCQATPQ